MTTSLMTTPHRNPNARHEQPYSPGFMAIAPVVLARWRR
jgi:hypothetical protein